MELLNAIFPRWGSFAYFTLVAATLIAAGVAMSAALIVAAEADDDSGQPAQVEESPDSEPRHFALGTSRHAR